MLGVNPTEVYISASRRGGTAYHTNPECPDLPGAHRTLTPGDGEFESVLEERDECQSCRYDTLNQLDLPKED